MKNDIALQRFQKVKCDSLCDFDRFQCSKPMLRVNFLCLSRRTPDELDVIRFPQLRLVPPGRGRIFERIVQRNFILGPSGSCSEKQMRRDSVFVRKCGLLESRETGTDAARKQSLIIDFSV